MIYSIETESHGIYVNEYICIYVANRLSVMLMVLIVYV